VKKTLKPVPIKRWPPTTRRFYLTEPTPLIAGCHRYPRCFVFSSSAALTAPPGQHS